MKTPPRSYHWQWLFAPLIEESHTGFSLSPSDAASMAARVFPSMLNYHKHPSQQGESSVVLSKEALIQQASTDAVCAVLEIANAIRNAKVIYDSTDPLQIQARANYEVALERDRQLEEKVIRPLLERAATLSNEDHGAGNPEIPMVPLSLYLQSLMPGKRGGDKAREKVFVDFMLFMEKRGRAQEKAMFAGLEHVHRQPLFLGPLPDRKKILERFNGWVACHVILRCHKEFGDFIDCYTSYKRKQAAATAGKASAEKRKQERLRRTSPATAKQPAKKAVRRHR